MPAKKKGKNQEEKVAYLGRPTNNVKIGIVGLPNVGKSSFFNCLSDLKVPAENFPFCTIDPAVTRAIVPDERYDHLVEAFNPKSRIPAVLNVTDIAGLVQGAHEGAGLGNAFLSHIAAVDAIFHVCREFKDKHIEHVENSVDPCRDLGIISNELVQKDLALVTAKHEAQVKLCRVGREKIIAPRVLATLTKAKETLEAGKDIRSVLDWNHHDITTLNELNLLTAKPVVYLVNVSKKGFLKNQSKWFQRVKEWCVARSGEKTVVIPFSASFERELADCKSEAEKKAVWGKSKSRSFMPKIIRAGYEALGLVNFFTCGADEVRAWTVRSGRTAPEAAGVIHGDFERCFIMAQQYSFDAFKEHGTEAAVKSAGLVRDRGKTYIVEDGDILFFKHNAGSG